MRREFYSENLLPFVRYWVIPNANEAIIMCMSCLIYLALGKFIENLLQNSFYPFMLHLLYSNTCAQHFLLLRKIKKEKRIREVYRLQLVFLLLFLFCFFRREGNVTWHGRISTIYFILNTTVACVCSSDTIVWCCSLAVFLILYSSFPFGWIREKKDVLNPGGTWVGDGK